MSVKTVLIPPILNWGFLKQLPQQIAEQFASHGYNVLFCNVNNNTGKHFKQKVMDNLTVYSDKDALLHEIKKYGIKVDIIYNTWAKNYSWTDFLKPNITIYHSCDIFDQWKVYEDMILKRADIVLCTSQYIKDIREKQHNNVHLVRNGVDKKLLTTTPNVLNEIGKYKGFKFAFVGALGKWVDVELISEVAKHYPTFFVGTEFGKLCPKNVIKLGTVPHDKLVDYYNCFDAFLLPFDVSSTIAEASCPIKLYEYMSSGKPIVSSSWLETEVFNTGDDKLIFTSKNNQEFISNVHKVASLSKSQKNKIKKRSIDVIKYHTWEHRFEQIEALINEVFS